MPNGSGPLVPASRSLPLGKRKLFTELGSCLSKRANLLRESVLAVRLYGPRFCLIVACAVSGTPSKNHATECRNLDSLTTRLASGSIEILHHKQATNSNVSATLRL